jgi:hypothetical protein
MQSPYSSYQDSTILSQLGSVNEDSTSLATYIMREIRVVEDKKTGTSTNEGAAPAVDCLDTSRNTL